MGDNGLNKGKLFYSNFCYIFFLSNDPNNVFSYNLNLSDINDLQSEFGLSMEDVWYFAPRLQEFPPFDIVICLIWTSPFTGARNPDWSDDVSKPNFKIF